MLSFGTDGVVEHIFIADYSGHRMQEVADVEALAGCGLQGDRYVAQTGFWSGVDECQVTLIESEILQTISEDTGLPILSGEHRRNIVTRGVRLHQLLGKRFTVGEAVFEFERSRPPCSHIQVLTQAGTARALFGQRGGIGARVLKSGLIRAGDAIHVVTE
jgi:MOSC domain-containing protein YiiM